MTYTKLKKISVRLIPIKIKMFFSALAPTWVKIRAFCDIKIVLNILKTSAKITPTKLFKSGTLKKT